MKLSPFPLEADLICNVEYFLREEDNNEATGPLMEVESPFIQYAQELDPPKSLFKPTTKNNNFGPKMFVQPAPLPTILKPTVNNLNINNFNIFHNHNTEFHANSQEEHLAEDYEKLVVSVKSHQQDRPFKLPSSKSPIMEALVYCAINKYGIELKELNTTIHLIVFLVTDFNSYYRQSCSICSKQSPSEDIRARMKALQRWFVSFPAWRELEYPFELQVRPSHYAKMHEIITKMVRFYENTET